MQTSIIIPALDLIDGHVVRLHQGDYAKQTAYSETPLSSSPLTCNKARSSCIWWI
ncbi:triose-phosphate isomerase [Aggregatibacter actinomycetemcomitans serotype e str. SC1083]|uniref:Triose-phosphate isomerase n=1 Tax=Aggregatibacter actinomycetemcomitans serotype e str. SC1083 TaxID=907488 RepID=G4A8H3_AGGAC|nr:triose-phosphate isomerase [Aggregatibacter actinomycetemcomitans serotype e str. SC1083]KYK73187.1 hypothetical protein SA3096_08230 [Aggregatibacter actinomycetemcomitans serotype e str. SA3096]KYK81317.1 hypothetical protein SC936_04730 [Aggregatibacter actinomycetemcomitans serotype e str. SC936]KYK94700.1 hypothetical protein ANH9776_06665 [Aggregatibacter actinomycetemcomitans serotype e str. ANH9776]